MPPIDGQPADVSIADPRCLVTGATGYVGGRLVPRLLKRGYAVRALARTPAKLSEVPWRADVEVAEGDLDDVESLAAALDGVDVVYYLVHSMGTSADYASEEDRSATNVVAAARAAGVRRLIYLGGLHPTGRELSAHMTSRTSVGQHLLDSGIEAVVLQAGVIIGSGSASFEMVRHLTDVLPVMTTPKWVHNQIQPIAIHDVLHYLVEAATADIGQSRTWDIGGSDILDYGEMMQIYAEAAGLAKRRILVLPLLTPTLASLWVGLVTPIPSGLARPLVESLQDDAVTSEHDIDGVIAAPAEGLTSYRRGRAEPRARRDRRHRADLVGCLTASGTLGTVAQRPELGRRSGVQDPTSRLQRGQRRRIMEGCRSRPGPQPLACVPAGVASSGQRPMDGGRM
ncbi:MAG: hypothetical protein QOG14_3019 [Mycobacterium sp.]|nr:hypothetical protein [Mycobacterium sp.]